MPHLLGQFSRLRLLRNVRRLREELSAAAAAAAAASAAEELPAAPVQAELASAGTGPNGVRRTVDVVGDYFGGKEQQRRAFPNSSAAQASARLLLYERDPRGTWGWGRDVRKGAECDEGVCILSRLILFCLIISGLKFIGATETSTGFVLIN